MKLRALAMIATVVAVGACASPRARLYPVSGAIFALRSMPERPSAVEVPARGTDPEKFEALLRAWRQELEATATPGGAVAVIIDGKLAFARGLGVRRRSAGHPVTPESLFRVASISKTVVAATAMKLVEAGELGLDDPITRPVAYFARGPGNDASAVTLRSLLSHTAGLPETSVSDCHSAGDTVKEYFVAHASEPLWNRPGEVFNYSNNNYALVAAAIAEVSGRSFEEEVTETIMRPAGMQTATYDIEAALTRDHVDGHIGDRLVAPPRADCGPSRAAGGVYASVTDYAHLLERLLTGGSGLLSPESVRQMEEPRAVMGTSPPTHYGYGLIVSSRGGTKVLSHTGGAHGIRTFFAFVPERRFGVVAFVNSLTGPAAAWGRAIDVFLDLPAEPEAAAPPSTFPSLVGTYRDSSGWLGVIRVLQEGDRLFLQLEGGQPQPIPAQLTAAFLPGDHGELLFVTRLGVARRR
jgi:CubicO group peptidase (beta-lactamase class C family)